MSWQQVQAPHTPAQGHHHVEDLGNRYWLPTNPNRVTCKWHIRAYINQVTIMYVHVNMLVNFFEPGLAQNKLVGCKERAPPGRGGGWGRRRGCSGTGRTPPPPPPPGSGTGAIATGSSSPLAPRTCLGNPHHGQYFERRKNNALICSTVGQS